MKFDRRAIMKAAWAKYRRTVLTFPQALHLAWVDARFAAMRFNVFGQRIGGEPVLIAEAVDNDRAGSLEWFWKCSYDRIWRTAA